MKLELVTEKIFTNIASYAYEEAGETYIGIEYTDDKKCIKIIFKDNIILSRKSTPMSLFLLKKGK
jgi:anti-sigma regulatory factor (Ser/Thr protein kinase)